MRRRHSLTGLVTAFLVMSVASLAARPVRAANDASPTATVCSGTVTPRATPSDLGSELPSGISIDVRVEMVPDWEPSGHDSFDLSRFIIDPGASATLQSADFVGSGLVYVEKGQVVAQSSLGVE